MGQPKLSRPLYLYRLIGRSVLGSGTRFAVQMSPASSTFQALMAKASAPLDTYSPASISPFPFVSRQIHFPVDGWL